MSNYITKELRAVGHAQVMAIVKGASGPDGVGTLEKHFCRTIRHGAAGRASKGKKHGEDAAMRFFPHLGVAYGTVDEKGLAGLQQEGAVAQLRGAPPLRPIRPMGPAAKAGDGKISWALRAMQADKLWKQGLTGAGIRVAHLDSGADGTHPALKNAIAGFAEFDALGRRVTRHKAPFDSAQHGTHTAGIIAGRPVDGFTIGVAPGAELLCGIVIEGGDPVARLLAGVDWAIEHKARILNLSLGFPDYWEEFVPLMKIVRRKGLLPVFAVGNEGPDTSRSPGNYADALSVGAFDRKRRVLPISSSQRFLRASDPLVPDLVMPGADLLTADAGGGYRLDSGTSMAAPCLSGLAALLWQAKPAATVDEMEACLFASCSRPESMPEERVNRGVPDAMAALQVLLKGKTRAAGAGSA